MGVTYIVLYPVKFKQIGIASLEGPVIHQDPELAKVTIELQSLLRQK